MSHTADQANRTAGQEPGPAPSRGDVNRAAFKGALIGSVLAAGVSSMLFLAQPAKSSATVLLPSLGTIIDQMTSQYGLLTDYVDQWAPGLSGLIESTVLDEYSDEFNLVKDAYQTVNISHAEMLIDGGTSPMGATNAILSQMQDENGKTDPARAAEFLVPPTMESEGELSEDYLNRVRDHALIMTNDQPIPQPSDAERGTFAGTQQEYRRLGVIQQRLLAQDAITQYPMSSPKMAGYRSYLDQVQSAGGSMSPGQLLSAQLEVMTQVAIPASLDGLESDLRRERLLGAHLASAANRLNESEGSRLAQRGE